MVQGGHFQQAAQFAQFQVFQLAVHGATGFGPAPLQVLQQVFQDRSLGQGASLLVSCFQVFGVDIQLARQTQGIHQILQHPALALVAGVGLGIHQIQHGPQAPGRNPHLVELLWILHPGLLRQQFLETRQADLEGAVQQDRQVGWVHLMIVDAIWKSEKMA